jgi:hypothetical protein
VRHTSTDRIAIIRCGRSRIRRHSRWGGSRRGGGLRSSHSRRITPATVHSEVNTRLISLFRIRRIPPPLQNAISGYRTLAPQIGHRNTKLGVIGRDGVSIARIIGEENQLVSDDCVGLCINDGNVCGATVRRPDFDVHREHLARCESLDVGRVVGELVALAEGELARGRLVVFLLHGDLKFVFDVTFVVRGLVAENFEVVSMIFLEVKMLRCTLFTARRLHRCTRHSRGWRGNNPVGVDGCGKSQDGKNEMHSSRYNGVKPGKRIYNN